MSSSEFKQLAQLRPANTSANTLYTNPGAAQEFDWVCPSGGSGGLDGSWILFWAAEDATPHGVYIEVDSSGVAVPTLDTDDFGLTITFTKVSVLSTDADTVVATAVQTAVNALSEFSASVSTNTVTVTCADKGFATKPTNAGSMPNITLTVTTVGQSVNTVGQKLLAMNIGAGANVIKVYQDADGTTYDATTQIWEESVPAGSAVVVGTTATGGAGIGPINFYNEGSIGVEAATADEVIFTLNGMETIHGT